MAKILVILPQTDFDPTEVALPWQVWTQAGHDVCFATETGKPATCDPITLGGDRLPLLASSLKARPEAQAAYAAMIEAPEYKRPLTWAKARAADYAALHFPGGHAPGMKSYCESPEVYRLAKEAFAAKQLVSAMCHGVLPLARAGVLKGRRTAALTHIMEEISVRLTASALPGHYRTYDQRGRRGAPADQAGRPVRARGVVPALFGVKSTRGWVRAARWALLIGSLARRCLDFGRAAERTALIA